MRKIPPFCPLRQDPDYNVEDCQRNKELQKLHGKPDTFMCRVCIDQELDCNGTN